MLSGINITIFIIIISCSSSKRRSRQCALKIVEKRRITVMSFKSSYETREEETRKQ